MSRARGFTCTLSLLQTLPRRRVGVVVKELEVKELEITTDVAVTEEPQELGDNDGDSTES